MGNQHPRFLTGKYRDIILNAKFGDGHLWKHPACKNYKLIFTSTTPELLEAKISLAPDLFRTGVRVVRKAGAKNCFKNAKTLYHIQSLAHEDISEAKFLSKTELIRFFTKKDFGLWYLDDGGFIVRNDANVYTPRFYLCVGDVCETETGEKFLKKQIKELFGDDFGTIKFNGSKATIKNKIWNVPHRIGYSLVKEAKNILPSFHKYPMNKVQRLVRRDVGGQG